MASISEFIEKRLKLKVNCNKSAVDRPSKRKFLGFTVGTGGKTSPAKKSIARFVDKVRRITSPTKGLSIEQVFEKLNPLLRGWLNYFGNCDTPSRLTKTWGMGQTQGEDDTMAAVETQPEKVR